MKYMYYDFHHKVSGIVNDILGGHFEKVDEVIKELKSID